MNNTLGIKSIQTKQPTTTSITDGYVFYGSEMTLASGQWDIQATKGDLWIFAGQDDAVVHAGEETSINSQSPIVVKSLYRRGGAKFSAKIASN